ncbi:MAG: SusC/RagA family TonB-linked outer membrane protein [Marinilabiliaceae bacterium]|nr:SusC/RagA family TonB-linked outer membrane protein [Marinilabiliaceae bacterium]
MRLMTFLVFGLLLNVSAETYSQQKRLSLTFSNSTLKEVFETIEKESDFSIIYKDAVIEESVTRFNVDYNNTEVSKVLNEVLKNESLNYRIVDNVILILSPPEGSTKTGNQQEIRVTGKVIDVNGDVIPGVNVYEKGNSINGVITGIDGTYTITMDNPEDVIVFSFIGFNDQEIVVGGRSSINITLIDEVTDIDEVVVTALGIERKIKALGYAVTKVGSDEVTSSNEPNVLNALQGKVAGLNITSTSGSSNGSSRIVLRGNSSVGGNNQALIVVDGAIYDNTTYGGTGSFDRSQGISDINANDIESVTVLKGPNAAALYGSKAANGVLVITTKKTLKKSGIGVVINSGVTFIDTYIFPELQNVYGQGKAAVGAFDGMGDDGIPILGGGTQDESWGPRMEGQQVRIGWLRDKPLSTYDPQPNNITDQFRTAVTFKNSIAVSSGNERGSYYMSMFNDRTDDFLPTSTSEKTGASIGVVKNISSKFSIDAKLNYTKSKSHNRPSTDFSENVAFMPRSVKIADVIDKYPESGLDWGNEQFQDGRPKLWSTTPNIQSPFWSIYENSNDDERQKLVGNVNINYKVSDWLSCKFGYNLNETNFNYTNIIALYSRGSTSGGHYSQQIGNIAISTTDFLLSVNKEYLDGNLSVSANFGANQFQEDRRTSYLSGNDFIVPGIETINNTKTKHASNHEYHKVINSLYGFAQVGYKGLVYLDLTARNDWSSTLSPENNSFFYPSVTTSFVFSELMDNNKSIFNFGKIRASWAEVGNDTNPYVINRSYSLSTGARGDSYIKNPGSLPFEDLQPE